MIELRQCRPVDEAAAALDTTDFQRTEPINHAFHPEALATASHDPGGLD
jgi:hypothetical protein